MRWCKHVSKPYTAQLISILSTDIPAYCPAVDGARGLWTLGTGIQACCPGISTGAGCLVGVCDGAGGSCVFSTDDQVCCPSVRVGTGLPACCLDSFDGPGGACVHGTDAPASCRLQLRSCVASTCDRLVDGGCGSILPDVDATPTSGHGGATGGD